MKLLGNPHKKFKSIHVAGTSGKGTTCWYIAQLLRNCKLETRNSKLETDSTSSPQANSKYKIQNSKEVSDFGFRYSNLKPIKIGLHVSPHLVDIRERMQILESRKSKSKVESLMPMGRFLRLFNEIKPIVEKIQRERPELTPSYFEILAAGAFVYFADERVEWAVVEVGLGGRLDATNVLQSRVAVITNIGLDHTEILGKTIEKIAYEKAGVIKKRTPVVTSTSGPAFKVIADVAKKQQAPLITINTQKNESANKFLALAAIETAGIDLSGKAVERAFEAKFPGRLEEIDDGVVLDGAHNADKVRFLIKYILRAQREVTDENIKVSKVSSLRLAPDRTITSVVLILAFKKGKDWKKMVDLLMKEFQIKKIIATRYQAVTDTGRGSAVEPEEIRDYVAKVHSFKCIVISNSQEAVFEALRDPSYSSSEARSYPKNSHISSEGKFSPASAGSNNILVLVTGSLYLVGEVRTMWKLPEF
ncbi:hypothetical protein HYZ70_03905 [Candidatus Curtissbacteria bacterium]|nr:hypothetical protein [Candidatus Curtissbacteria bacterium]